nr:MAG TPA_asm: hypothetical protein [Caudoviricetes sp.]
MYNSRPAYIMRCLNINCRVFVFKRREIASFDG